ncbi:MAG: hypothetical protein QGF25_07095 [Candidatus Woesearchaeota archaeon]|nr:hypothetical protein [Candidatus Woesearchaeota archaeon]MDP7646534.1 hypothetical protein [Candidatus Woesearchaeota archaeon]
MSNIVDQIILDIQEAPTAFLNLALTDDNVHVFGPMRLEEGPTYGYSDRVIAAVENGDHARVVNGNSVALCGGIHAMAPEVSDGQKALPLMMRLARAGIIRRISYSEGQGLDTWRVENDAGPEMRGLVMGLATLPSVIKDGIARAMRDAPSGMALDVRILRQYE